MNLQNFLKQHKLALIFTAAALALTGAAIANRVNNNTQETVKTDIPAVSLIAAKDYAQIPAVEIENGGVQSLQQAELKAQMTAAVAKVGVKLGDNVRAGQVLLQLQNNDIQAQLAAAQANLESLQKGARTEDLAISQTATGESRASLVNSVKDAYAKSDDSIHNHIDKFFANPDQANAQFLVAANVSGSQITLQPSDADLAKNIAGQKYGLEAMFASWQNQLTGLGQDPSDAQIETAAAAAQANLQKQIDFLNAMAPLVNDLSNTNATYKSLIDGYKTEFSAARAAIAGSLASLQGSETAWRTSQKALDLKLAGATAEQLKQAQAAVDALKATLAKTAIVAPVDGKISYINGRIGELVAAGQLVAAVVNPSGLQVKSYASETDLPLISVGDRAEIDGGAAGIVSAVSPAVDLQTKKGEIIIAVTKNAPVPILIGQNVSVKIAPQKKQDTKTAYLLPIPAVQFGRDGSHVLTVNSLGMLEAVPVETGELVGENVRITKGLAPEMRILSSVRGFQAGDAVKIQE